MLMAQGVVEAPAMPVIAYHETYATRRS
jgi:hypothetical protein